VGGASAHIAVAFAAAHRHGPRSGGTLLGVIAVPLLALEWVQAAFMTAVAFVVKLALRRPWHVEAVLAGRLT
jgi:hypothetical protein